MTIGELARRAGVRPSAIRYYESVGLMAAPARVSGRRAYDAAAVTQAQTIGAARALGFNIREIRTLVRDGKPDKPITDRWRALAERKLPELDALVARAMRMKHMMETSLACRCVRIEDCILHGCAPPVAPVSRLRAGRPLRVSA